MKARAVVWAERLSARLWYDGVAQKLQRARVNARVADYWIRLSPSVFNDMADVERLLEALA